jgi:hypothetical protein
MSAIVKPLFVGVVDFLVMPPSREAKASPPAAGLGALSPTGGFTPEVPAVEAGCAELCATGTEVK